MKITIGRLLICVGILFLGIMETSARVIFVRSNMSGTSDGHTWDRAFSTIADAIRVASQGDSIWVSEGIYHHPMAIPRFEISIYGGFAGNERSLEERDWETHPTLLSENVLQKVEGRTTFDGLTLSQSQVPTQISGKGAVFQNCIFRNNQGERAGAVECMSDSSTVFTDCIFEENISKGASAVLLNNATAVFKRCSFLRNGTDIDSQSSFATLATYDNSFLQMNDCRFHHNQGRDSGGILSLEGSTLDCRNTTFQNNVSQKNGGAVSILDGSATIDNCLFTFNLAQKSGGAMAASNSYAQIQSSTFSWNKLRAADSVGGALLLYQGTSVLTGCLVSFNSAKDGGGIAMNQQRNTVLKQCLFQGNASKVRAGAIYCESNRTMLLKNCVVQNNFSDSAGGGLYAKNLQYIEIEQCQFKNNHIIATSGFGAGIGLVNTPIAKITECVIQDNTINLRSSLGAGLYGEKSGLQLFFNEFRNNVAGTGSDVWVRGFEEFVLQNCTLSNNVNPQSISIMVSRSYKGQQLSYNSQELYLNNLIAGYAIPIARYSNSTFKGSFQKLNNVEINDFSKIASLGLVDPDNGNFHLNWNSPLIDSGQGSDVIDGIKPFDGNGDGSAVWDIGAYEYRGD